MNNLGKSVFDIELLMKKESERENLEDTRFLKKEESSYNSYNSNATNFDTQSQSSRKRQEMTSIMNHNEISSRGKSNKNSYNQSNYDTNDDLISLEGKTLPHMTKRFFGGVNRSCMNLKKKYEEKAPPKEPEREFKKKNLLTHSMIVTNYIGTPAKGETWKDSLRDSNPRPSLLSQKSMKFHRSSIKKSPESSFLISKKMLSPIQMAGGESFLKVNLSKIPSDTGRLTRKGRESGSVHQEDHQQVGPNEQVPPPAQLDQFAVLRKGESIQEILRGDGRRAAPSACQDHAGSL